MRDKAELYRAINANLQYVYSGQARRDKEARAAQAKAERKEQKRREKEKERKLKSIPKRLEKIREELEGLDQYYNEVEADPNPLGYAEGMDAAQKQGLLEEIEVAREGCLKEIIDLEDELRRFTNEG